MKKLLNYKFPLRYVFYVLGTMILLLALALPVAAEHHELWVDKEIYQVWYDEELEQPTRVTYWVTDRPKNVDRKGMNFYKEADFHTSDDKDYYMNVWDKGHIAPAAHFSDSKENLKATFSYLNSALQHEKLNRGAWRFLEAQVRKWGEDELLFVENDIYFSPNSEVLPTGATVPDGFQKNIEFTKSGKKRCFFFPNEAPDGKWQDYETPCLDTYIDIPDGIRG